MIKQQMGRREKGTDFFPLPCISFLIFNPLLSQTERRGEETPQTHSPKQRKGLICTDVREQRISHKVLQPLGKAHTQNKPLPTSSQTRDPRSCKFFQGEDQERIWAGK